MIMASPHPFPTRADSGRLAGDDGAILVEFALVLPLLMTLLMSVYEGGVWFLNSNRMNGSIQLAARTIASQGRERMADNAGLLSLRASSASFSSTIQIDYVIIYKANTQAADGKSKPSNACLTKAHGYDAATKVTPGGDDTAGAECNIYTRAQLQQATTGSSPGFSDANGCTVSAWDQYFCPTVRKDALSGLRSPLDYVGVWVEGTYTSASRMLFQKATVTDYAVYRIEPAPGS
jgi:Flp pilus assembly protein TadG